MSLEVSAETEVLLTRNARESGLSVDDYLQHLMQQETHDFVSAIEQGLDDVAAGRVRPAREALKERANRFSIQG